MYEQAGMIGTRVDIRTAFPDSYRPGTIVSVEIAAAVAYVRRA